MALTPEDVVNKRFTITKFRDGYDLDQVDDFLDEVGIELRRLEAEANALRQENEELRDRVQSMEANEFAQPRSAFSGADDIEETVVTHAEPVVSAPTPAAPALAGAGLATEASKSSGMLQLALELHDKHVRDGEEKRDALIREGESTARELVSDAQKQRADELARLNGERAELQGKIKELREFEGEYRSTLRSYIQGQLRGLDGSPEPEGAPAGLD
ncbi:hypothetical protein GCM10022198_07730 [Klugiella xanthotipulae]|uniref:Cell wall synthesis protein Wag31 n=1 Tax=Klugiella xanthotipulae TaxID=244735 RepID=A0A543HSZ0_9MICO|nr:DivIVA domain-containing protein [Klugiella xanthotipulae]TQM61467.1 DivIVA domain-containing protein [Klugiella xanthotipulae]